MKMFHAIFLAVLFVSYSGVSQTPSKQEADEIKPVLDVISDTDAIGAETLKGLKTIEVRVNIRELFEAVYTTQANQQMARDLEAMVKTGLSKWGLGIAETRKGPGNKDWVVFEINVNIMQKKEVMPGGVTYSEIYFYYIDVSLRQLVRMIRNLAYKSKYPVPTWTQYAMGSASSVDELADSIRKAITDLSSDFLTAFKFANRR